MSDLEARLRSRLGPPAGQEPSPEQPAGDAQGATEDAGTVAAGVGKPSPRSARQGASQGGKPVAAPEAPTLSDRETREWQWRLGNAARKCKVDLERADQSAQGWVELVAKARAEGVPEHLLVAAAAAVNLALPDPPGK